MKKSYSTFVFFLFLIPFVTAQPVLELSDMIPEPSETFFIGSSFVIVSPGPGGANQNWDFSELNSSGDSQNEYQLISDQPGAEAFPMATHVLTDGIAYQFVTYNTDSLSIAGTSINFLGEVSITALVNPFKYLEFPVEFGNSYLDTYTVEDTENGNLITIGELEHTVDGFGTLTLPSVVVENVVRINREGTLTSIEYDMEGNVLYSVGTPIRIIDYMAAGYPFSLVTYTIIEGDTSITYTANLTNSVKEEQSDFSLFPNPAVNGEVNLISSFEILSISIYDITGKFIRNVENNEFSLYGEINIDISDLGAGLYLFKLKNSKGLYTQRLLVE